LVKLLLEKGADISAADADGLTALMRAEDMGRVGVMELLVARGAEE
jgi:ankyrin repeat protein